MNNKKQFNIIIGLVVAHILLLIFIQSNLDPIKFTSQNFFTLELLGKTFSWPNLFLSFFDLGNIILLWLVGKKVFSNRFAIAPAAIYAICPWGSYLVAASSLYIYFSFLILLIFYSLISIKLDKRVWSEALFIFAATQAIYDSFLLFITLSLLFVLIILTRLIPFKDLKRSLIFIFFLSIPLLFIISKNPASFGKIKNSEIKLFSDPGLLNMVNSYQGAGRNAGFGKITKVSENKYIFNSEYILLKYLKNLTPTTYFTQQEKLLNFSFSPPIYIGFLIPFLYGLYWIFQSPIYRKVFLLSTLLVIPSILSKQIVDLNREILFAPIVIIVISYGLVKLIETKKKTYLLLIITLFLVFFQLLVTISDIQLREKDRYIKYYGQNYDIGKQ